MPETRALSRFFVSPDQIVEGYVALASEEAHKIGHVLRMKAGDEIAVLDGSGSVYRCRLTEVGARAVARIEGTERLRTEPSTPIILAQALPKGDKLELVVRQCTEAGAAGVWVLETERCVTRLDARKAASRIARLQRVAREAAEQSSRAKLPEVLGVFGLSEALERARGGSVVLLYEGDAPPLREELGKARALPLVLMIGPEGGFSDAEVALAVSSGAGLASLGPRVLRTETAGVVALASTLFALEG